MVQLTFNHMPFVALPLVDELRVGARLRATHGTAIRQGLWLDKVHATGWQASARAIADAAIGYVATGPVIGVDDDAGWRGLRTLLADGVRWCADVNIPIIYFTSGRSGRLNPDAAADAWCRQIEPLASLADTLGVHLALENSLSLRAEISFVHSVREAAELASRAGIGLCVDLFSAWQEHHLRETLTEHLAAIRLLQYSDYRVGTLFQPARCVPGDGDIPLQWQVDLVRQLGYTGVVDLELMGPDIEAEGAEAAVDRGLRWLTAQNWG